LPSPRWGEGGLNARSLELRRTSPLPAPGDLSARLAAHRERPEPVVLGQLLEPDPEHQLGAATRPAALVLDLLQAFEETANIDDRGGTVSGQHTVNFGQVFAGFGGKVGDVRRAV